MNYVVDFEGFSVKGFFVIKEFVVASIDSEEKNHFILNSPILNWNYLRSKDRKSINYCEKYLHQIRWGTRGKHFSELKSFLNHKLTEQDTIFIKGSDKLKIFCKQINPKCVVKDINDLLSYAQVSKDWTSKAKELLALVPNKCPLYFHKLNHHCAFVKTEVFAQILLDLNLFNQMQDE